MCSLRNGFTFSLLTITLCGASCGKRNIPAISMVEKHKVEIREKTQRQLAEELEIAKGVTTAPLFPKKTPKRFSEFENPMEKKTARDYHRIVNTIRQKPWDASAVLALADWFEASDKPRAKLVRLQLELSPLQYSDPRFQPLRNEISGLINEYRNTWSKRLSSLADRARVEFEVGLIDSIQLKDATDIDLVEIEKVPEVRVLRLESPKLSPSGYERLARLPNLDSVTIEDASLPKESLAQLEKLPPWVALRIYGTDDRVVRAINVRRMAKFQEFSAEQKHVGGVRFLGAFGDGRPVFGRPHTGAQLSQSGIDDTLMPFLATVPELEGVYISESNVTNKGIVHLAGLKGLKSLGLYQTNVTSIAALAGLTKLDTLGIFPEYDIKMGDKGLTRLRLRPTRHVQYKSSGRSARSA